MISCKSVAKLLTSDQLQAQSWWKRTEVRVHLAMCKFCSRLSRQIEQLRSAARAMRSSKRPTWVARTVEYGDCPDNRISLLP